MVLSLHMRIFVEIPKTGMNIQSNAFLIDFKTKLAKSVLKWAVVGSKYLIEAEWRIYASVN